jgi:hypothetical protein
MKFKLTYGDKQRDAQKRKKEEGRQKPPEQQVPEQSPEDTPKVDSTEKPTGKKKKRIA